MEFLGCEAVVFDVCAVGFDVFYQGSLYGFRVNICLRSEDVVVLDEVEEMLVLVDEGVEVDGVLFGDGYLFEDGVDFKQSVAGVRTPLWNWGCW